MNYHFRQHDQFNPSSAIGDYDRNCSILRVRAFITHEEVVVNSLGVSVSAPSSHLGPAHQSVRTPSFQQKRSSFQLPVILLDSIQEPNATSRSTAYSHCHMS